MRLSNAEVQRREEAVLSYFLAHPKATGEMLNKALTNGTVTGKPEPALNIKKVYVLRNKAREVLASGDGLTASPRAPTTSRAGAEVASPSLSTAARSIIKVLQAEIQKMAPDVTDITVHRDGRVLVGRMTRHQTVVSL